MTSLGPCVKKGKYNAFFKLNIMPLELLLGYLFNFPRTDHMPFFINLYRHVEGTDICVVRKSIFFEFLKNSW
jgi:hypothetical protein